MKAKTIPSLYEYLDHCLANWWMWIHRKVKAKKQIVEEPYQPPSQSHSGQKSYKELIKESNTARHKKTYVNVLSWMGHLCVLFTKPRVFELGLDTNLECPKLTKRSFLLRLKCIALLIAKEFLISPLFFMILIGCVCVHRPTIDKKQEHPLFITSFKVVS